MLNWCAIQLHMPITLSEPSLPVGIESRTSCDLFWCLTHCPTRHVLDRRSLNWLISCTTLLFGLGSFLESIYIPWLDKALRYSDWQPNANWIYFALPCVNLWWLYCQLSVIQGKFEWLPTVIVRKHCANWASAFIRTYLHKQLCKHT